MSWKSEGFIASTCERMSANAASVASSNVVVTAASSISASLTSGVASGPG